MANKKRAVTRKTRPQSVVENLSLGHIPDLLESPSSHRAASQLSPHNGNGHGNGNGNVGAHETGGHVNNNENYAADDMGGDEGCDSITELPSTSFQLQHLVKGRPKRAKTRAPTRPLVALDNGGMSGGSIIGISTLGSREFGEGLEHFFRPGSVTPTTLTPLVSPTSEECSSLSFVDSPTMSRDGNGHMTSEETTPILEERKPIKLDRSSPLLKSTCGAQWNTRSRSTDNLEKYSPLVGRKSPLVKMRTECDESNNHEQLLKVRSEAREEKLRSPSNDSIKSHGAGDNSVIVKSGNGVLRTPIVLQKPRPWSVVGSEPKSEAQNAGNNDSSKTTPEKLVEDVEVLPFGQCTGGSIVGISLGGIAMAGCASGGGSIVGITPGAALEKKSVRELAAGLNRLDLPLKPKVLPRSLLTSKTASFIENTETTNATTTTAIPTTTLDNESMIKSTNYLNTSTATTTITESSAQIITSSRINNETNETFTKTIISENGNNNLAQSQQPHQQQQQRLKLSATTITTNNNDIINEIRKRNRSNSASNTTQSVVGDVENVANGLRSVINVIAPKRIAGKEISALFEETLVEGLQQRNVGRRTLRDTHYTNEDVVDL